MKYPVEIKVQIDPECHDPVILIRTDEKNQRVEDIVHAIETCTESSCPLIAGYHDNEMELLSGISSASTWKPGRSESVPTREYTIPEKRCPGWKPF